MNLNYFTLSEFDSPDLPNSGVNMDEQFLAKLEQAREIASIPFRITSGYRTKEYNQSLRDRGYKASNNSSHLIGVAADIAVSGGNDRYIILSALIKAGFRRIGVAKTFIHCDTDDSKPNSVWTY